MSDVSLLEKKNKNHLEKKIYCQIISKSCMQHSYHFALYMYQGINLLGVTAFLCRNENTHQNGFPFFPTKYGEQADNCLYEQNYNLYLFQG